MAAKNIFDLTGKVALITGASRGLGRAFAEAMAEFGADVACVGRDEAKLAETVKIISKFKHRAIAIKADVTDESQIQAMVAEAVKKLGKIDIFFNNAGIARMPVPIHETPTEDWDAVINTNLRGAFLALKHVLGSMVKNKSGSIINISSIAGLRAEVPEVGPAAYGAAHNLMVLDLERPLKSARPLVFDGRRRPPYLSVSGGIDDGVWTTRALPYAPSRLVTADGKQFFAAPTGVLVTDESGKAVGFSMDGERSRFPGLTHFNPW